jgi:hypothetical protein
VASFGPASDAPKNASAEGVNTAPAASGANPSPNCNSSVNAKKNELMAEKKKNTAPMPATNGRLANNPISSTGTPPRRASAFS